MNRSTPGSLGIEIAVSEGPQAPPYPGPFDIPALIDDVKRLADFNMTRLTFFTIETTTAVDDWVALLRERGVPFLLLGISPVIHRPNLEAARFGSTGQIDQLLNAIEEIEGLVVETAHIWVPNFVFEDSDRPDLSPSGEDAAVTRGAVWRLSFGLFQKALLFQREIIGAAGFSEQCRELMGSPTAPVTHSPEETRIFRDWSAAQIEEARQKYQKRREERGRRPLRWRDKRGRFRAG
jgi:hypothetical protein